MKMDDALVGAASEWEVSVAELHYKRSLDKSVYIWEYL